MEKRVVKKSELEKTMLALDGIFTGHVCINVEKTDLVGVGGFRLVAVLRKLEEVDDATKK